MGQPCKPVVRLTGELTIAEENIDERVLEERLPEPAMSVQSGPGDEDDHDVRCDQACSRGYDDCHASVHGLQSIAGCDTHLAEDMFTS